MHVRKASLEPIEFKGLRIFDYTAGDSLSSSLAVVEVPAGASHPEAWSKKSDKYYLLTEGRVEFVVEGESTILEAGDLCLIRRGERFSYNNGSDRTVRLVVVHTPMFRLEDEHFV